MDIVKAIAITAGLVIVLNLALLWTNNIIFVLGRKPVVWIVVAGLIGFGAVLAFAAIGISPSIAFWAAVIALLLRIPPKQRVLSDSEFISVVDDAYAAMGITHGRLKYRFGLVVYTLGCIGGYVVGYAEIVRQGT